MPTTSYYEPMVKVPKPGANASFCPHAILTYRPDLGFRPKPRLGLWNHGTAWSRTTQEWYRGVYNSVQTGTYYGYLTINDRISLAVMPNPTIAIARSLKRVKGQTFNLAQSLAEYRQTVDMYATTGKRLYTAFRNLRRGKPVAAIKQLLNPRSSSYNKSVANDWLQVQYGLTPHLSDLWNGANYVGGRIKSGINRSFTMSAKENYYKTSTQNTWPSTVLTIIDFGESTLTRKGRYKVSDSSLKTVSELGFTNPALLAWELVPYSFVADWFVGVGDWLGNLDALIGVEGAVTYHDIIRRRTTSIITGGGGTASYMQKSYARSALFTMSGGGFSQPIAAGSGLSSMRTLNAAALIRQLL